MSKLTDSSTHEATVLGGGLAGTEAALQLARRGVAVTLVEMRPWVMTPAHHSDGLAELVCSNSLKSDDPNTAAGLLKLELERLGSIVVQVARETAVPAGAALAVDRRLFSERLTKLVEDEPLITLKREEAGAIPEDVPVIVATGPLTSEGLEPAISRLVGEQRLAFFDAAAPVIDADTIDREIVFAQSRYDKGSSADYLNAPMTREEYETFVDALLGAQRTVLKDFETRELFQACQPIEEVARAGRDAPRFGAMKPVGITDPRTGTRPWAVVQLRAENREGTAYNLVGFQTNLRFEEQRRVFGLIPGLKEASFLRYGVMHRNTFIDSPRLLDETLALRSDRRVRFAGQITGTEGYLEAAATGLYAALNTFADMQDRPALVLPQTTALGSLVAYATGADTADFQPMHVNFGLVPPLEVRVRGKRERYAAYSTRAVEDLGELLDQRTDGLVISDTDAGTAR